MSKTTIIKSITFISSLLPILWCVYLGITDNLGANQVERVIRYNGDWALNFILIGLSITPIITLFKVRILASLKRQLGLWAFTYIFIHVMSYVWLDQWFDWVEIYKDIIKHKFILVGMLAFVLALPLAITSNNYSMNKLKSNWKKLHRLAYVIAILGVLHYFWMVKKDITLPTIYAGVLLVLLGFRLVKNKLFK